MNLERFSTILNNSIVKSFIGGVGNILKHINTKIYLKYSTYFKAYYWKDYKKTKDSVYFLKWITPEHRGVYFAGYKYHIPSITRPPLVEHEKIAEICKKGFHCSDHASINDWACGGDNKLYVIECFGEFDVSRLFEKICFTDIKVICEYNSQLSYPISNIIEFVHNIYTRLADRVAHGIYVDANGVIIKVDDIINEFENTEGLIKCNLGEVLKELMCISLFTDRLTLCEYVIRNANRFDRKIYDNEHWISIMKSVIKNAKVKISRESTAINKPIIDKTPSTPTLDKYTGKPKVKRKPKA